LQLLVVIVSGFAKIENISSVTLDMQTKSVASSPQANYTERPPLVGEVSAKFSG
jgi:hypothetical protein